MFKKVIIFYFWTLGASELVHQVVTLSTISQLPEVKSFVQNLLDKTLQDPIRSIDVLYINEMQLYIPKDEFVPAYDLQEFFAKNNIILCTDINNDFITNETFIKFGKKGIYNIILQDMIEVERRDFSKIIYERLSNLILCSKKSPDKFKLESNVWKHRDRILNDAKLILKSFLLEEEAIKVEKNYFVKNTKITARIFAWVKIQEAIEKFGLSNIKISSKKLVIWDRINSKYLFKHQAEAVIDKYFKLILYCFNEENISLTFNFNDMDDDFKDNYELRIFASKELCEGKNGFSKETQSQLVQLCRESPFDVGSYFQDFRNKRIYGSKSHNIFWNKIGNAIIIDTEAQGAVKKSCLYSIENLYPVDVLL